MMADKTAGVDPQRDWVGRITLALQAQDMPGAFRLAAGAVAADVRHPLPYRLLGAERDRQGRWVEAVAAFRRALSFSPDDGATLNALGLSLARLGQVDASMAVLDRAAELSPQFAPIRFNQGWVLEQQGRLTAAEAAYAQAIELDPAHAPAMANLAVLHARRSRWVLARRQADAALAKAPGLAAASLALIMADLGEDHLDQARVRLDALLAAPGLSPHERAIASNLLGEALDRSGDAPGAYAAYLAASQGFRQLFTLGAGARPAGGLELVRRIQAQLDDANLHLHLPASAPSSTRQQPVFLLSFPRSATTLTGQILAAHPGVVVSDEQELFADAGLAFLAPADGLKRLADADEATLQRYRNLYAARVRQTGVDLAEVDLAGLGAAGLDAGDQNVGGKLFVDKLPMNTLALPLIARLFPKARIIFMLRDPRDVVWSCFRQRFIASGVARDFTDLQQTADLYAAVMTLAHSCIDKLDLTVRFQSYERLVADFDGEVAALCDFVGLEPCAQMADFAAGVSGRDVATPSGVQIARGLNADSIGAWRRYVEPMAPVMPRLAPWVQAFGYAQG